MPETTLFERTCRGERNGRVPVWVMRQAGRYLPEYRALRERVDFLTATRSPEVAAEITLQPMRRFPLDAAIVFSDIMTPLEGMGVTVEFDPGPVLDAPIRTAAQASSLRELDPEEGVPYVLDTLRFVRSELEEDRALIGFAGAPFTLFCYLVEGGGSKDFAEARGFLRAVPELGHDLLDLLGRSMSRYLVAQARAGANVLMLFDSWVGLLAPSTYRRFVLPVLETLVESVRARVDRPIIYFANGAASLLTEIRQIGADVIGIDWTVPLSTAVHTLGKGAIVQGNLDPAALFATRDELAAAADEVLREGEAAKAHVFNLGHGIHRKTDPDQLAFLVDHVHERSAQAPTSAADRAAVRAP
jgi:uroporphyrinogen decarboxylase